ncbi:hypothetical protein BCR34DRAFT_613472 [Clohesyomyces aquaticus]|uniref:Uncharacterized protein n=1 Tax=Clohesyomyces aquaticus TaxID=1231657 RepID=A0A1Y1ZU26_9PLEO|nr:hypothetical protein BCR34DRAFT_613472 [Clohesyomyces aquaticus]
MPFKQRKHENKNDVKKREAHYKSWSMTLKAMNEFVGKSPVTLEVVKELVPKLGRKIEARGTKEAQDTANEAKKEAKLIIANIEGIHLSAKKFGLCPLCGEPIERLQGESAAQWQTRGEKIRGYEVAIMVIQAFLTIAIENDPRAVLELLGKLGVQKMAGQVMTVVNTRNAKTIAAQIGKYSIKERRR